MWIFCSNFATANCVDDMKKQLFLCLIAAMAMAFTACSNNESQLKKRTVDLAVQSSQWEFDQDVNQYYCHFNVPELTAQIYNYGEVSVNREYNSGTKNAYQVALPETSYKVEYEVDENDSVINTFYYAQHIDYAYGVGFVEVFYTISDYFYPEGQKPEGMLFRLQMTY
jgi:hypothetical protein